MAPAKSTATSPIPLIVGAGPTGLLLSLWLLKFNVPHRIVDAAPKSGLTSRAIVVHARTLEFYRQLDLADALMAEAIKVEQFAVYHSSSLRAEVHLSDSGRGLSNYPFALSVTQDDHEALLERAIIERGGKVEREIRVTGIAESKDDNMVNVVLTAADGKEETVAASYVVGCDGSHSVIRHSLGIAMEGGTYDRSFFVADVITSGSPTTRGTVNMCLSNEDFLMVIPMPHEPGRSRLIGFIPREVEEARPDKVTFDDVKSTVRRNARNLSVSKVNWFSRYKVHHRRAARFRLGRFFLCGDAAHIHSPVGGQGMNTGLGDATNLAWKLAAVYHGASPAVLDTYEPERVSWAQKLVKSTDSMFTLLTGSSYMSLLLRNVIFLYVMPVVLRLINVGPAAFLKTSQIEIEYWSSPMSTDVGVGAKAAVVKAGNRLPWVGNVDGKNTDNHAPSQSAAWQAHVYGKPSAWIESKMQARSIPLHSWPWTAAMAKAGLKQDVTYLVRPDGHIGLMLNCDSAEKQKANEAELDAYLERWSVGKPMA